MNSTALPVSLLPVHEVRRAKAPFLPLAKISGRTVIWCVLLGVGIISPFAQLIGWLNLPVWPDSLQEAQRRWLSYLLHPEFLFLRAVLIYPIIEEVFYRGLILPLLRRYCSAWVAISVSSVLFGMAHLPQGFGSALNAFVLGLGFAMLVIQTRSLFASMLCHATINFTWLFLVAPAFGYLEGILQLNPALPAAAQKFGSLPAWWLVTSVTLAAAAVVMLKKFSGARSKPAVS
jgi:membrane protease YdiL (CAAX protease family)